MAKEANSSIDFQDDVGKPVGDLKRITELAAKLVASLANIAKLEDNLKLAKLEHEELETITLPSAMLEVGMTKFTLTTGEIIEAAPFIRASIPSLTAIEKADADEKSALINRREEAFVWLKTHNAGALIKNQLTVEFGKGQDAIAKNLFASVLEQGLKAKCEESVHFQTLNSFVKENLAKGVDIPFETFSIFSGHKATIKKVK